MVKDMLGETFLSQDRVRQRGYEFDSILLSAVDRIAKGIFGQEAADVVFSYIDYFHGLKFDEISTRIELFDKALEDLLGCGAAVVKRMILRDICSCLDAQMPDDGDFISAIRNARALYIQASTSGVEGEEGSEG